MKSTIFKPKKYFCTQFETEKPNLFINIKFFFRMKPWHASLPAPDFQSNFNCLTYRVPVYLNKEVYQRINIPRELLENAKKTLEDYKLMP